jgi:diacylglycerol kinase family enzyme
MLASMTARLALAGNPTDWPRPVDVAELAREAIEADADLLGVAGGDGTQAMVAGIAAEHGIPFVVISAGTRNRR